MPVALILTQPVENLGAEADLVKVKPGYARNWLLPQGFATRATDASKKQIEALRQVRTERENRERQAAEELAGKLNKLTLTFQMNVGEDGDKIFGSVTTQDIVQRLAEAGHTLEKKKLQLSQPLKTLGEHIVQVQLGYDIHAKLKVVLDIPAEAKARQEAEKKAQKEKGGKGMKGRKERREGKEDQEEGKEGREKEETGNKEGREGRDRKSKYAAKGKRSEGDKSSGSHPRHAKAEQSEKSAEPESADGE